ncbi:MAG: DHH family phosphoesterase [Spirochaetota bacterium]
MLFSDLAKKLEDILKQNSNLLIYIQGSPDPDAMASSFALQQLARMYGCEGVIAAMSGPSLPQNRELMDKIGIEFGIWKSLPSLSKFDGYAVLDYQTARVQDLSRKIPCLIHIDHHVEADDDVEVRLKFLSDNVGSTSTVMAHLVKELQPSFDEGLMKRIATALVFGIQNDTDNYTHASKLDYDALEFLAMYSDGSLLASIMEVPLSGETVRLLRKAVSSQVYYRDWIMAGVGYVEENNRDSIAIIADFLLVNNEVEMVVVFALVFKDNHHKLQLDASFRTNEEDLDLDYLIKEITSDGGGRRYKGAYQVNLDYFSFCPDMDKLWEVVHMTTIEALKKKRDMIQLVELKSFYHRFRVRLRKLFN